MHISIDPAFKKKFLKLNKRYSTLGQLLDKKLALYLSDPTHKSLRLHKLGSRYDRWSITIKKDLRVIFVYIDDGIYLTDIGSHDEVYR